MLIGITLMCIGDFDRWVFSYKSRLFYTTIITHLRESFHRFLKKIKNHKTQLDKCYCWWPISYI